VHFTILASHRAQHQLQHQAALAEGLKALGIHSTLTSYARCKTKFVACWGWRAGSALRSQGHEVLVMERAYLGNRFEWTSLAWNGLNGNGTFAPAPKDNGERFKQNFAPMKPWNKDGEYILIMGQVPGDASLRGQDMVPWYEATAQQSKELYGKPVHYRAHPEAVRRGYRSGIKDTLRSHAPLDEALAGASLVITYNSNSAVDSVLAGKPTIAADKGSMAWPVTGHFINDIVTPEREEWAHELAWRQWQLDEIKSGKALSALLEVQRG
jgi:hypothetical protein